MAGSSQGSTVLPLFDSRTPEELDALVKRAQHCDPTYVPVNLNSWHQVFLREEPLDLPEGPPSFCDPCETDRLVAELLELPEVETASGIRSGNLPGSIFDDRNHYLGPANKNSGPPHGLGVAKAWEEARREHGINPGEGVQLIDIEEAWYLDHEDLPPGITVLDGLNPGNSGWHWHGTNVLGTIFMQPANDKGGAGIAWGGKGRVAGRLRTYTIRVQRIVNGVIQTSERVTSGINVPVAVLEAVLRSEFGDVILLEDQTPKPEGRIDTPENLPVELCPGVFDIIRIATAVGVIVIEPAGNADIQPIGSANPGVHPRRLVKVEGTPTSPQPGELPPIKMPDSGAIIVGASNSTDLTPKDYSNFGNRVDVFAWGDDVCTTGPGKDFELPVVLAALQKQYRPDTTATVDDTRRPFNGTSAAGALIAGVVMLLQSIAQKRGSRYSPVQMRKLLKQGGTPSSGSKTDYIGVMPNLEAILDLDNIPFGSDIFIRRTGSDTGLPIPAPVEASLDQEIARLSASPDIFISASADGSGPPDYHLIVPGERETSSGQLIKNFLSVGVRNRSRPRAEGVKVTLYWSKLSTCQFPASWSRNTIHTFVFDTAVTADSTLVKSQSFVWNGQGLPSESSEDFCLIAIATSPSDPGPNVISIAESLEKLWTSQNPVVDGVSPPPPDAEQRMKLYLTFLRNNNNIAHRKFNVPQSI